MFSSPVCYNQIDTTKYKVLNFLKKGTFGRVFLIEENETNKKYAAKVINCDHGDDLCNRMLYREIDILTNTNNPTIIEYIGYSVKDFENNNNLTIFMEYAQNGSLLEIINRNKIAYGPHEYDNTKRQIILVGISRGMRYLHDRYIIHRDLKSENILLDNNFYPKISDFGLSKRLEFGNSFDHSEFGIGTLPYIAPEIINLNPYDRKADVYSFGIIMYEVLTDKDPYPELIKGKITVTEFKKKVAQEKYRPDLSKFPIKNTLKNLIEQCLLDNPQDRPSFKEIFEKLAFDPEYSLDDIDTDEINAYIEAILTINDPLEELLFNNDNNKNQIKKLELLINELENENSSLSENIEMLTSKKDELNDDLIQCQKDNNRLQHENAKTNNEKQDLLTNFIKLSDIIKEFSQKNKELMNENDHLKKTIDDITDKYNYMKKVNTRLSEEKENLENRITSLSSKCDDLESKYSNIEKEMENMLSDNTQKEIKINQLNDEIEELKQKIHNISIKNEELASQNDKLSTDYKQLKEEKDELSTNYEQLKEEKDELSTNYEQLKEEKDELSTNYEQLKDESDKLSINYEQLKEEKDELSTNYEQLKDESDKLSTNHEQLKYEKDELSTNYEQLKEEKDKLNTNYKQLKDESDKLNTNYKQLKDENDKIKNENILLKSEKRKLIDKNKRFQKSFDRMAKNAITSHLSKI